MKSQQLQSYKLLIKVVVLFCRKFLILYFIGFIHRLLRVLNSIANAEIPCTMIEIKLSKYISFGKKCVYMSP